MNTQQKIAHLRQTFGLGMMESAHIIKCIEMQRRVREANTFEELKAILVSIVDSEFSIDHRYPLSDIILSLSQSE